MKNEALKGAKEKWCVGGYSLDVLLYAAKAFLSSSEVVYDCRKGNLSELIFISLKYL